MVNVMTGIVSQKGGLVGLRCSALVIVNARTCTTYITLLYILYTSKLVDYTITLMYLTFALSDSNAHSRLLLVRFSESTDGALMDPLIISGQPGIQPLKISIKTTENSGITPLRTFVSTDFLGELEPAPMKGGQGKNRN